MSSGQIHIGIDGESFAPRKASCYPKDLPARHALEYASRHLSSIKVNGICSRTQSPETIRKWRVEAPDGFVFARKTPHYATNRKVLAAAGDSIARFLDSGLLKLSDKLGPISWQLMATQKFDPDDFAVFLARLPDHHQGRDLRGDSFHDHAFIAIIRDRGIATVFSAEGGYTQITDPTAPFVYARIMGISDGRLAGYEKAELDLWAARFREWDDVDTPAPGQTRDVWLYVVGGHKAANPQAAMAQIERLA